MVEKADHAVVIGGSIAGLAAAGALSAFFSHVTVVDRDELGDEKVLRRGVPQGNHLHAVRYGGRVILDDLFGTFTEDLCAMGAPLFDFPRYTAKLVPEGWLWRSPSDVEIVCATRPLTELVVRRLVRKKANIEFIAGSVTGLTTTGGGEAVTGVQMSRGMNSEHVLDADLVVDASGRGSKSPAWVERIGYRAPEESVVKSFLGYATVHVHVPENAWPGDIRCVAAPPFPGVTRGGFISPLEDNLVGIMAAGQSRDYPPRDPREFAGWLETATTPIIRDMWLVAEQVSEIAVTRTSHNRLRRWHELERRPGRFIVVGDAAASFNPVYGTGMTTAAIQAKALGDRLAELDSIDEVVETFQQDVMDVSEFAWSAATEADMEFEGTEVTNLVVDHTQRDASDYFVKVRAVATFDPYVSHVFNRTVHTQDDAPLHDPEFVDRVLRLLPEVPKRSREELAYPPLLSDAEPVPALTRA